MASRVTALLLPLALLLRELATLGEDGGRGRRGARGSGLSLHVCRPQVPPRPAGRASSA